MNNTIRLVHVYEKPRVNRKAIIFGILCGLSFIKYVDHIDRRVIKLEKEIKKLRNEDVCQNTNDDLDKDILEEDFLK